MKTKTIAIILAVIAVVAIAYFAIMSNKIENKYGVQAYEDAKSAIFLADQYLDRNLTDRQFSMQLATCKEDVDYNNKAYDIYANIIYMDNAVTDASVLKYRNALAKLIKEDER
jgi:uncharacterized protein (UPF0333 family)